MRYILFLVPLLLAGGMLRAQPENLLLSRDPVLPVLPEEIRIQSAAMIDQTALIVWGSTREGSAGEVRNVLYGQIVRNDQPVGSPEIILAPDAVPFDFVMVLNAGDRFRVLWSDRRGGVERIYHQDIDLEGRPIGEESVVAEGRERMVRKVQGLEGAWMIELSKGAPVFIRSDGSIDHRRVNPHYLTSPAVTTADSSLVLIYGDSIYTYPTLFDTVPTNVAHYAREDSALKETEVLIIDSTGRYRLFFVTAGDPGRFTYYIEQAQFRLVSGTISPETGLFDQREEVLLELVGVGAGAAISSSLGYGAKEMHRACDFSYRFCVTAETVEKLPAQPEDRRSYSWYYQIDEQGIFSRSSASEYNSLACLPDLHVVRHNCPSASCVKFNGIEYEAPAVLQEQIARHTFPHLTLEDDRLSVSWIDNGTLYLLRSWELPGIEFGAVRGYAPADAQNGKVRAVSLNSPRGLLLGYTEDERRTIRDWTGSVTEVNFWNFQLLLPIDGWWVPFGKEDHYYQGNWKTHHVRYLSAASGEAEREHLLVGVTDSYTAFKLTLYDSVQQVIWERIHNTASDDDGSYLCIAPLGEDKYIDISNRGLARIIDTSGNVLREASLDEWLPASSNLVRLRGTWSLVYHLPHDGLPLRLRIYDENLLMMARWEGEVDSLTGLAVAQNREDASIALVISTATGTRLTVLDGGLRSRRSAKGDSLVNVRLSDIPAPSYHPTALFRNDTLIVAWEDHRGENPDIYGAYFRPVDYVSGVGDEAASDFPAGSEGFRMSVRPNPADGKLLLDVVGTPAERVRIELVDMLGRKVITLSDEEPGGATHPIRIDLEEIPSGAYLLNVSSAGASVSEPVLVRHSSSH